jgi:DNA primase
LILGFINFPEALPEHCQQLAHLDIRDRALSNVRERLVEAALSRQTLDREALVTILQHAGSVSGLSPAAGSGKIGYSFTRSDAEPERAVRDLGVAIDALAAEEEIGAALLEATERLMAGDEDAFDEQRRLHVAREEIKQRLASLAGTE